MSSPEKPKPSPLHGIDLSKARIVNDPEEIRRILEYEEPGERPPTPPEPPRRNVGTSPEGKNGYDQQSLERMMTEFQCSLDQIAFAPQEINEGTKAYVGPIAKTALNPATNKEELLPEYSKFFLTLPPTIEHIYVQFPEKKIRREEIEIGGKTVEELKKDLKKSGIKISNHAEFMLGSKEVVTSKETEQVILIRLTIADLGFKANATIDQIFQRAQELGLELCPPDTGPNYRLKYQNQPLNEWIFIGMKQIPDSDGDPNVFRLGCNGVGLWLNSVWTTPAGEFSPDKEFAFRLRKLKSS